MTQPWWLLCASYPTWRNTIPLELSSSVVLKRTVPADQLKLVRKEGDDAVVEDPSHKVKEITNHRCGARQEAGILCSLGRFKADARMRASRKL